MIMGIFDRFRRKKLNPSPAQEDLQQAETHFKAGNYQEALGVLAAGFNKDIAYKPLYRKAADCLAQLGATQEQTLFENALKNFEDFAVYRQLGAHFYEVGHLGLARPFLEKAVTIDSQNREVNFDLAVIYARRFQVPKAIEMMELNPPEGEVWNIWFLNKLRLMANQPDGVAGQIAMLRDALTYAPEDENTMYLNQKLDELTEMLERYEQLNAPEMHIRDWHFIQYGSVILDFFDTPEEYVAGGRHVAAWGTMESVRTICRKLQHYLEALDLDFQAVRYLPNRDAEIVGRVVAQLLQIPLEIYDNQRPSANCLIVAAHGNEFDDFEELAAVQSGQILFALNHPWLESTFVSPDIIGLMSQMYVLPWAGGGYRVIDEATNELEQIPPDLRTPPEIAAEILQTTSELEIVQKDLGFYLVHQDFIKAIGEQSTPIRHNFMIESPVPGAFFGT